MDLGFPCKLSLFRIIGGIHPKKRWQSCSDVGTLMILISLDRGTRPGGGKFKL